LYLKGEGITAARREHSLLVSSPGSFLKYSSDAALIPKIPSPHSTAFI